MKHIARILILTAFIVCCYGCGPIDTPETPTPDTPAIKVESVTLNQEQLTLTEDDTYTLVATIAPENADNKDVEWTSTAPDVASVNTEGKVTALAAGTTTITVTTTDGSKTDTCEVTVEAAVVGDVDSISDLTYTVNTPADEFYVTWSGVANAVGYKCWYVIDGDPFETETEATDNGNGTWTAKSSTAMGAATYTFYALPIPAEGHSLKSNEPASVVIILPELQKTGFSYRFMSDNVEENVEYETACYDLEVKYMNIQFLKSDKTQPIADNWYIYTTTPVENIHHLEMWYSLNYDDNDEPIKVYSSTEPGKKEVKLTPDGDIKSGKWKVYYAVPEGHKYIYIEGNSQSTYMLWTSFYLCHTPYNE